MGLIILIYVILVKIILRPIQRGFYCNDPDIQSPLYSNSVPTTYLLLVTLGIPFFVVLGGIFLKNSGGTLNFTKKMFSKIIRETTFIYLDYVVAFGIITISLEFIKCATGRLRPNFLSLCRPDLSACELNKDAFIEDYTCNPLLEKYGRNSKMSFPSGHAAAAVFAQIFVIYFCRFLFKENNSGYIGTFRRILNIGFSVFSVVCSFSRIWDRWHFFSDVLGGVLVGITFFYATLWKYTSHRKSQTS